MMNDKIELLKNVEIFSKLRDNELNTIGEYSQFLDYPKEAKIFNEGSECDALYVVKKGEVRITQKTEDRNERDIAVFIAGENFGELDLFENRPHTATAIAEKDTTLLIFPVEGIKLTDILKKHPDIFARIFHKLVAMIAGRIRQTNSLVSKQTPWIEDLRKQVLYDKLTGLYNRTFLQEEFPGQLSRYGSQSSLIVIKPDNFKEINDTYGHDAGDKALRLIADTFQLVMRDNDIKVRYRGDEFIGILPNTGKDDAVMVAGIVHAVMNDIQLSHITEGKEFKITFSLGIATYPDNAADHEELIKKAFDKMLEARDSGGNKILSV